MELKTLPPKRYCVNPWLTNLDAAATAAAPAEPEASRVVKSSGEILTIPLVKYRPEVLTKASACAKVNDVTVVATNTLVTLNAVISAAWLVR